MWAIKVSTESAIQIQEWIMPKKACQVAIQVLRGRLSSAAEEVSV